MAENLIREAQDLAAVHGFYMGLLQRALSDEPPVPESVRAALSADGALSEADVAQVRRWLNLLDLAITPVLVRDALKESATYDLAQCLLRYLVRKASPSDDNRDKTDFVVTYLFRTPPPGAAERKTTAYQDVGFVAEAEAAAFEKEVLQTLAGFPAAELPPEHRQLVREFSFIREEVEEFRDFDRMMDAGVVQRVREIKQSFGRHFYHPTVLATVASYNAFFGRRFDELFRKATEQIKHFAEGVQQQGGSLFSRVDDNVLLKELAEVEESAIMKQEYGRAQEHFRRVSRFKKAVENRRGRGPAQAASAAASAPAPEVRPGLASAATNAGWREDQAKRPRAAADEELHIQSMHDSIRSFASSAKPGPLVMPLRHGKLILTAQEADAFRADYAAEKSFRGQYVSGLTRCLAIQSRMIVEMLEYEDKKDTEYLWKAPADSLAALLNAARGAVDSARQVAETARQRGLNDKAAALESGLEKLQQQAQAVAKLLGSIPAR